MDNESFEKIMSESDCALFLACYKVDSAKIETALQNGANVNAVFSGACPGIDCPRIYQGYTPILIVAEKVFGISEEKDEFRQRLLRSLEILLKYGADINATADNGSVCVLADAAVYESDCEIHIVGVNDLTTKTFRAVSVFVDKNFEGIGEGVIDLTQKLVIISSDEGCKIKNI